MKKLPKRKKQTRTLSRKSGKKRKRKSANSLRTVRINVAAKRRLRALRSKAKRAHRLGTGVKDIEE